MLRIRRIGKSLLMKLGRHIRKEKENKVTPFFRLISVFKVHLNKKE